MSRPRLGLKRRVNPANYGQRVKPLMLGLLMFLVSIFLGLYWLLPTDRGQLELQLWEQKIPGKDWSIVQFELWYGLDGHHFGRTIVKDPLRFDPFKGRPSPCITSTASGTTPFCRQWSTPT